jgi:hypothetical protein
LEKEYKNMWEAHTMAKDNDSTDDEVKAIVRKEAVNA